MAKLKVFRTSSGFHDSYVAAPSRAAALRAWGANTDLFAMGAAEEVTDAKLMAEPLATPGAIVKRSRGTAGEHMSAAASRMPKRGKSDSKPPRPRKVKPPPSRAELDQADRRLAEAEARHELARAKLDEEVKRLNEKRRKLEQKHQAEIASQRGKRDRAAQAYRTAVKAWQATSD